MLKEFIVIQMEHLYNLHQYIFFLFTFAKYIVLILLIQSLPEKRCFTVPLNSAK